MWMTAGLWISMTCRLSAAHWQMAGGWAQGNFLGDAVVDINDLSVLSAHWQTGIGMSDVMVGLAGWRI